MCISMNSAVSEPKPAPHPPHKHILVADDDPSVRLLLTLMLGRLGYKVTTVNDGESAIELVITNPSAFGTVILDIHMPGLNGVQVMDRIRSIAPEVNIVLTSGTPMMDVVSDFAPRQPWSFLEKPFQFTELGRMFPPIPAGA